MKRAGMLVLAMFACLLAVSVSRGSPGPEPLQYEVTQAGLTAPSNSDVSSVVVVLGVLAVVAAAVAIVTWRGDKMRIVGSSGNIRTSGPISKGGPACGKAAGALDALASVG